MRNGILLVILLASSLFGPVAFSNVTNASILINEQKLDAILEKHLESYMNLLAHYPRSFFPFEILYPKNSEIPSVWSETKFMPL